MKTLECEQCNKTITSDDWGIKFDDRYFCSQECLDEYVSLHTDLITAWDFEENGEDDDEDEDEVVNDYNIQMSYEND